MNSSLEHEFVGFEFSKNTALDENSSDVLKQLDEKIELKNSVENLTIHLSQCEICGQEFSSKKDLRSHILIHLGEPRVVLKRISNLKTVKKKHSEKYRLNSEQKGSLKLTIKKEGSADSLKLTLKKSSLSEDFTIINSNLDTKKECYKTEEIVAGTRENDTADDVEEASHEESYKTMTVNEEENYGNDNFDDDEATPLEEIPERPSMDTNEGDSGVGSDMANPLEREDQSIDDLQNSDHYENSEKTITETEEHDDPDALEATCRETIENLRRLGEQSSSRPPNILSDDSPAEDENLEMTSDIIPNLEENTEVDDSPKPSTFNDEQPVANSPSEEKSKSETPTEGNSNFDWTNMIEKESEETNVSDRPTAENNSDANISHHESLLQNFLIEHHKRNQSDAMSNNVPPFETEYVSLEKLAETVNTCRVCNEKFKDIAHLDSHRLKMGHYQCNIPDCSSLVFNTPIEVSVHKAQVHGAPMSPNISQLSPHVNPNSPHLNQTSPHLNQTSPHLNQTSPHLNQTSPHLNQTSPHLNQNSPHHVNQNSPHLSQNSPHTSVGSPSGGQIPRSSPLPSPQQTNSPTFNNLVNSQQMLPPVNFEQLPAPVQQLAQQVQRMPLPQAQIPPSLPPGANTMIPGTNYYVSSPGRPPMYRIAGPQPMHYPHIPSHMYPPPPYGPPSYPQIGGPPQLHPSMPQQISRGRYPTMVQNVRAPRAPQNPPMPRQRLKRPMPQQVQMQQSNNPGMKQRRMDVLIPDRNEDADCHVIAQQKRNDGIPVIQNVQGAPQPGRTDSTIHLTDSITLSVRQPGSAPAQVQNSAATPGKKADASAVANVLAARGITVTPASNKNKANESGKQPAQQQPQQRAQPPVNMSSLNLNSAISIIPASAQRKQQEQQNQFVVPQNTQKKQTTNENIERPPRPPTVDLTQDGPPPPPLVRRGRPPRYNVSMLVCQVCDKRFQNQELLTQHMATHRATNKLLHKCHLCPAQYPTLQALTMHKQTYHKEVDTVMQNGAIELAIPVVDLKSPHAVSRLSNLGIQSYIPLSQLSSQAGGYFGLPIVNVEGARNPNTCNLGALGAMSILSLGPLKHLSNR